MDQAGKFLIIILQKQLKLDLSKICTFEYHVMQRFPSLFVFGLSLHNVPQLQLEVDILESGLSFALGIREN